MVIHYLNNILKNSLFKVRLISALVLVIGVVTVLFRCQLKYFGIGIILICILVTWEWGKLLSYNINTRIKMSFTCSLLLVLVIVILTLNIKYLNIIVMCVSTLFSMLFWTVALMFLILYPRYIDSYLKSKIVCNIISLSAIVPFFSDLFFLHQYHYMDNRYGIWLLFYLMVLTWSFDSSSYIFGIFLGKNRITPIISPNKTWEGLICGVLLCIVLNYILIYLLPINFVINKYFIGILVAVFALLGDLTESMLKRRIGIKNSSNLIPGHGGILDRIDSLMAVIPAFTCMLLYLK